MKKLALFVFLSVWIYSMMFSQSSLSLPKLEIKFSWEEGGGIWVYDSTHQYSYDHQGNRLLDLVTDTTTGQPLRQHFRQYNDDNRLISDSLFVWQGNSWLPINWLTLQYYDHPNAMYSPERAWNLLHPSLKEGSLQTWNDSTNNWDTTLYYVFQIVFDPNGRDLAWTWLSWKPDTSALCGFGQELFEYNPQGQLERRTYQTWDNGLNTWQNLSQVLYTYKSNGETDVKLARSWNAQNGVWVNAFREHRFHFDSLGNVTKFERQNWANGLWINIRSLLTSFQADNRSYIRTRKIFQGGLWLNDRRWHQFYDTHENEILNLVQDWDSAQGIWVNRSGYELLNYYDASDRLTEKIRRRWDSYQGFMVNEKRSIFANFQLIGNVGLEDQYTWDNVRVFPNPTIDKSLLLWEEEALPLRWELYDTRGSLLRSEAIKAYQQQASIDLRSLPNGIYRVRLVSKKGIWSANLLRTGAL